MSPHKTFFAALALAFAALAAPASPAGAAPSNTAIVAVHRCATSCGPALSSGAVVGGEIKIDVASDSNVGLTQVRLEAMYSGESAWQCAHIWSPSGARHFSASATWNTAAWPRPGPVTDCTEDVPHKHGEPTPNGAYSLRVVATESGSGAKQTSSAFVVRLDNPPEPPSWRDDPAVQGGSVTLRWYRNAEPDVNEYRLTRTDGNGSKVIAIDVSAPPRTPGCQPEHEAVFTCVDKPAAGRVTYKLQAFRPSPAGEPNCRTDAEPCIGSAAGPAKKVTVAASNGPGPASSATSSAPPPSTESTPPASATTPSSADPAPAPGSGSPTRTAAAPAGSGRDRGTPLALAAAALAALVAAHAWRAGRRAAAPRN